MILSGLLEHQLKALDGDLERGNQSVVLEKHELENRDEPILQTLLALLFLQHSNA